MKLTRLLVIPFSALLLTSCKDAKPQLNSLLSGGDSPSMGSAASFGNGRATGGSADAVATTNYKIKGRVALTPQDVVGVTPNYRVRGRVEF